MREKKLEINDILIRIAVQPPNRLSNRGRANTRRQQQQQRRPLHTHRYFNLTESVELIFRIRYINLSQSRDVIFAVAVFALFVHFAQNRPQI